jgi:Cyclic nucleotide-binding domain
VDDNEQAGLLAESLLHKARTQAIRALNALSLLGESREEMTLAIQNLLSQNPDQRTNALETLEALGSYAEIVRPLIRLWEPKEPMETRSLDYVLHILQDDDGWLRACGALAAGQIDHWEVKAALETLANSDRDPLVRETADTALTALYRGKNLDKLSLIERVLYLRRVSLFVSLPPAELKPIALIADERRYADGELIVKQGDPGDRMYVLTSGEVRVLVAHGGEPGEVARRGPGDVVGEVSMISQEPRMASLVAAGEVRTLAIGREPFEKLLRERPEISLAVMRVLCARISEKGAGPHAV